MTPREVVTRAVEFRRPPRLAIRGHGEASDFDGIGYEHPKPPEAAGDDHVDQDHTAIGTAAETKQFMLGEFRRLDPYRSRWRS